MKKKEIENALIELSKYNPADFYSDEHVELSGDCLNFLGEGEKDG